MPYICNKVFRFVMPLRLFSDAHKPPHHEHAPTESSEHPPLERRPPDRRHVQFMPFYDIFPTVPQPWDERATIAVQPFHSRETTAPHLKNDMTEVQFMSQ